MVMPGTSAERIDLPAGPDTTTTASGIIPPRLQSIPEAFFHSPRSFLVIETSLDRPPANTPVPRRLPFVYIDTYVRAYVYADISSSGEFAAAFRSRGFSLEGFPEGKLPSAAGR